MSFESPNRHLRPRLQLCSTLFPNSPRPLPEEATNRNPISIASLNHLHLSITFSFVLNLIFFYRTMSQILRPASRLLSTSSRSTLSRSAFQPAIVAPTSLVWRQTQRRSYANPSGTKEMTVRDALNEALAEELESNPKVFVLGEE